MTTPADSKYGLETISLFVMANLMAESELSRVEQELGLDLQRGYAAWAKGDESYYPQIESAIRAEASRMAPHYEIFYSLERSIRVLVGETLASAEGEDWWTGERVPPEIKKAAEGARKREVDSAVTPRSDDLIDYTTFGELSEIIKTNWDLFGALFSSVKAVQRVMNSLNTLRGPIAHCSPLSDDEVVRLRLSVRDWFRVME